jgi:hypothetical protein
MFLTYFGRCLALVFCSEVRKTRARIEKLFQTSPSLICCMIGDPAALT